MDLNNGADLNKVKIAGNYKSDSYTNTFINAPEIGFNGAFLMEVDNLNDQAFLQKIKDIDGNIMYRHFNNNKWYAWKKIV